MIRMVFSSGPDGGEYRPTVFCDHCGSIISLVAEGMTAWFPAWPDQETPGKNPMQLYTIHRRCNRAFEAGLAPTHGRMYWDRLSNLPRMLTANLGGAE